MRHQRARLFHGAERHSRERGNPGEPDLRHRWIPDSAPGGSGMTAVCGCSSGRVIEVESLKRAAYSSHHGECGTFCGGAQCGEGVSGADGVDGGARPGWIVDVHAVHAPRCGRHLGIPYSHPYGHRGAWHSPVMAVLAAALLAPYLAKLFDQPRVRTFVVATLVIASHGLLDTLTDGGEGIALLWPFSDERYFAPFRPIPVSPLGMAFLSERGLMVAMTELIYCLPLWAYLGWPNNRQ